MVTITINGQDIQVEDGTTVIQAAEKIGVDIPRYCYHPGMSIAGSCRMCMVEIENMPKLAIACYTRVSDGMKVSTTSDRVLHGRSSMLEFLLHNHPLDCPVCDQSGECDLQNFYMEHGRYESRFIDNKVKKRKAFPVGPHVMLDQERCILCTRCTRFCQEVSKSHELGIFNRGDRSVVDLNPGKTLDNVYSGNVIDICPVGALTEREFRFKCRVWYLATEQSICTGCARGCSINIHFNRDRGYKAEGRRVQRLKPRYNPYVNEWWMCDQGRFGYGFIDQERLEHPRRREGGSLGPADWDQALDDIASALRSSLEKGPDKVGVVASPQLSNEDLYLVRKLFQEGLGVRQIAFRNPWEAEGPQDDLLLRSDRNPNTKGAETMGLDGDAAALIEKAANGEIETLLVFEHDLADDKAQESLAKVANLIFIGAADNATSSKARWSLPSAVHAEKDGTFTNFEGRVQRFHQALQPLGDARPAVDILLHLAKRLEQDFVYRDAEDLFMEWFGKQYGDLDPHGEMLAEKAGARQ